MMTMRTCRQGHRWQPEADTADDPRGSRCPVCGAPASDAADAGALGETTVCAGHEAAAGPPGDVTTPVYTDPGKTSPLGASGNDDPYATRADGAAAPVARPVTATVPGYEIVSELGRGGMGVVYLARDVRLDRRVALKMILAGEHAGGEEIQRFRSEARAIAQLQSQNIIQIYEVAEHDGRPYFALEYCAGGSLARRAGGQPMPPAEAAALIETLARAVQVAHDKGIVHRDLKPANILLSEDGTPKITDFGLAKRLDEDAGQTHTGAILGTPNYMAPEQAEGHRKQIGPPTDVYALGAILYELLAGRPPHQADSALQALRLVATQEPMAPSQLVPAIPRDLEAICLMCLEKSPARRYPTARALAEDLARFRKGEPVVARHLGRVARTWKWLRRHPRATLLVGAALALIVVGALALLDRQMARERQRQKAIAEAPLVRDILERNCYECHGRNPRTAKKKLDVLNHAQLIDSDRRIVVPGEPGESRLIQRIRDGSMPPEEEEERLPRLADEELTILNDWILGGAPPLPLPDPQHPVTPVVPYSEAAAKARDIFVNNCYECHKFDVAKGGIKILHHRLLVTVRKVVIPHKPEQSELFQLITSQDDEQRMPPAPYNALTPEEIATIRRWIDEGAAPFPRPR